MSKHEIYEEKATKLLEPILKEMDFELVDVEYVKEVGNWYLRSYIDKPGGITVDDCEAVSRLFSDKVCLIKKGRLSLLKKNAKWIQMI